YGELRSLAEATRAVLRGMGVSVRDRVAIVLPNGPIMAASFLTVGAAASTAPLNPAYRREEYDFYLGDLRPKLLIVAKGEDTPARASAEALGIAVVEVEAREGAPAGEFVFTNTPSATAPVSDE